MENCQDEVILDPGHLLEVTDPNNHLDEVNKIKTDNNVDEVNEIKTDKHVDELNEVINNSHVDEVNKITKDIHLEKGNEANNDNHLDYDSELLVLGEWGWFQKISFLVLCVYSSISGLHVFMFAIMGLPDHNGYRCRIPGCDGNNFSFYDYNPEDLFPKDAAGDFDYCEYFQPETFDNGTCSNTVFTNKTVKCSQDDGFAYAHFELKRSVATRFNLVCDDLSKLALVGMMYMAGVTIGSFISGYFSDKFGRKKTLLGCTLISFVGSFAGAFMPEYISYTAFRFITGFGAVGLFNESFTLTIELMGSKEKVPHLPFEMTYKSLVGNVIQCPYPVGSILMGFTAWAASSFEVDYVTLQASVSSVTLLLIPLWFLLPESPRWLISNQRTDEAKSLLEYAAKKNGVTLDLDGKVAVGESSEEESLGFKDLFKSGEILKITLVLFICWPVTSIGYYGLGLSMTELGFGNIFVNFILGSAVEIPGFLLAAFVIDVCGRKPFFFFCLLFTGVCCVVGAYLPVGLIQNIFVLCAKMFAAANFSVVFMYTAEIYPTTIRDTAIGSCYATSSIGSILAPLIPQYLGAVTFKEFPMLLMGGLSVIAGFLVLFLPETLGSPLPETMEDVKKLRNNEKPFWSCNSKQRTSQIENYIQ